MKPFSNNGLTLFFYRMPVAVICVLIFWQSCFPGIIREPHFPQEDKVLHFTVYGLLAFMSARWLAMEMKNRSIAAIKTAAIVFACLYGLSDEIHQAFVPARQASVFDFLADVLGSFSGVYLYFNFFLKKFTQKPAAGKH